MGNVYIYALMDRNQIRYIGVTKVPVRRLKQHLSRQDESHRGRWIRKVLSEGRQIQMSIVQELPSLCWQEAERYWMSYFRGIGCDLVNSCEGGLGVLSPSEETRKKLRERVFTEEWRARMSAAHKGRSNPCTLTPEALLARAQKVSESKKGLRHSEEHKKSISESLMGHRVSDESKAKRAETRRQKYELKVGQIRIQVIQLHREGKPLQTICRSVHAGEKTVKGIIMESNLVLGME